MVLTLNNSLRWIETTLNKQVTILNRIKYYVLNMSMSGWGLAGVEGFMHCLNVTFSSWNQHNLRNILNVYEKFQEVWSQEKLCFWKVLQSFTEENSHYDSLAKTCLCVVWASFSSRIIIFITVGVKHQSRWPLHGIK